MSKILFFPKYTEKGASSRYRTYQYLEYFKDVKYEVYPLFDDAYDPGGYLYKKQSKKYIIVRYLKRAKKLFLVKKGDVIFLEKEFFPFTPYLGAILKLLRIKYIVDYDDAIFHKYNKSKNKVIKFLFKNKIDKVLKNASRVITGSPYLTEYALNFNKNVIEIPTSIDFNKYNKDKLSVDDFKDYLIIGWIGSGTTSINILKLLPVFKRLQEEKIKYKLHLIGFNNHLKEELNGLPVEFIKWSSNTEVNKTSEFDVGIMPLDDNHFNRGKCAFKLIQYMACAIPTVSTPMEANIKVDRGNGNLFASNTEEWYNAIISINNLKKEFKKIGLKNRDTVQKYYSKQSNYKLYRELLIRKENEQ
ncbi:glycosyltransferase [Olleya namhaensis]|uniref:glycosyltransferase n=1 Tax=Olleya namhaensis TaxID=1144750 RepID=UPI002492893F|nr:glycosyltransferase [Olleya namhaensis]